LLGDAYTQTKDWRRRNGLPQAVEIDPSEVSHQRAGADSFVEEKYPEALKVYQRLRT